LNFAKLISGYLIHGPKDHETERNIDLAMKLMPMPVAWEDPKKYPLERKEGKSPLETLTRPLSTDDKETEKQNRRKVELKLNDFFKNFCRCEFST
jgi:hypothetical protein